MKVIKKYIAILCIVMCITNPAMSVLADSIDTVPAAELETYPESEEGAPNVDEEASATSSVDSEKSGSDSIADNGDLNESETNTESSGTISEQENESDENQAGLTTESTDSSSADDQVVEEENQEEALVGSALTISYNNGYPVLEAEDAKVFLAFLYNDSSILQEDLTDNPYYNLLIGNHSVFESYEEMDLYIYDFSVFVRDSMRTQESSSSENVTKLSSKLEGYLKKRMEDMPEIKAYKVWANRTLREGLSNIFSNQIAEHSGIYIAESTYEDINLFIDAVDVVNDEIDIPYVDVKEFTENLIAAVDGALYVLQNEFKGRSMYFNSYLSNRPNYSSPDDSTFQFIMDYNELAARENSAYSKLLDSISGITGKDSWSNHIETLNHFAEYFYQLEQASFSKDPDIGQEMPEEDDSDNIYLENLERVEYDRYTGNEGDSFVYTIGKHRYTRGATDINGKTYKHGIECWVARWNNIAESSWAYSVYKLNRAYSRLSGKAVLIKSYNTTNFDTTLYFYGDDKLLASYNLTPQSFPFDFSIGLTNVNNLKIYVKDNRAVMGGTSIGLTDCQLTLQEEPFGALNVGDGVTADFDAETGAVVFYSKGGTLWKDWISKAELDKHAIESIAVADTSGKVFLPSNSSYMFYGCDNLTALNLSGFGTSNVTDMSNMFVDCSSLVSLDLSGFDTSNVTDMNWMFGGCSNLMSLDLTGFETSNVTDMSNMFVDCSSLVSLDLSGFDTSNVTDMNWMFEDCGNLTALDLSMFNTSNVTDMSNMFDGCSSLMSLDLSGFDTSNVTDMNWMFDGCSSLMSLDLSGFDTSNVTDMNWMFEDCGNLTALDLSTFNTSNVTNMSHMFDSCSSLMSLDLSGFDTSNVKDMAGMFEYCNSLTILDLSGFDTLNVTDMNWMFMECGSLTALDLSGFKTLNVTNMGWMFEECGNLTALDLSGFDTSNVTNMRGMFLDCSSLASLDLSGFNTSNVKDLVLMLSGCGNLTFLKTPRRNSFEVALPITMYDSTGTQYTSLPILSESITLTSSLAAGDAAIVYAASLTLEGQIGVNIKLILPDSIVSDPDAYVVMEYSGEKEVSVTTPVSETAMDSGRYVFTCPVAVKEINDPVSIRVYRGDGTQVELVKGETSRIPVEENCFRYAVSDYIASKKTKTTPIGELTRTMSDFGAAARLYFNYEADGSVIEADLSGITADDLLDYKMELTPQGAEGIKIYGASLMLESEIGINIKFSGTDDTFDINNYTFTVDGSEVTPTAAVDGKYQINIRNIAAKDLDKMYTVTVTDRAGNSQSIRYGALSYAYSKLNSSSSGESIRNLSKCLYLYNQAANTYFNN